MNENTWIKLYRKFAEWEWFNISEMVHLFVYLLISANNVDDEWRGIKVKRGQLITGRKSLKESTGISEQTLRTCLRRLESSKEITIQSTNKYSIITVCKYDEYQPKKNTTNQQSNQQLTNNQPTTNHKQEYKEDKKYIYSEFYDLQIEEANDPMYELFVKFIYGANDLGRPLNKLLKMQDQIGYKQYLKLKETSDETGRKIYDTCRDLENYTKKTYSSFYLTLNKWLKNVRRAN